MESDDLLVTLGLSSSESGLRTNGIESFESIQGMEFNWINNGRFLRI